jgi:RNA polymerase sigma-32 factor
VPRKKQDPTAEPKAAPKKRAAKSARSDGSRGSRSAPASEPPPSSGRGAEEEESDTEVETGDAGDGEPIEVAGEVVDDEISVDLPPESAAPASTDAALSRRDPLQAYLREIQRHPLLTHEEEQRLTRHYQETQDVNTAARLVTANLRLVVKLAYEYRRAYKNIMDLIQEGNIGLMQAVKRYDPYRGVKLSSYAAWWIRAYILRFILNNWRLVKLGTTQAQRKLFFNLNKEKAKLAAMGIDATADVIAERLGVEEKEVVEMDRRLASAEASLDAPVGDAEGRSVSRVDLLPSTTSGPEVLLERQQMDRMVQERLREFRDTLKGKDVIIFDKRMAADEPLTLQELGDEFGISRERVRQLEARLTSKLRDFLKAELGDAVGSG